ncbi:MAG: hypothetical protein QOI13_625 [Paraburkholderia sp.]|jgi:hypothetical protein|nr:hypothetical protein [Paraburkholderia sp.]
MMEAPARAQTIMMRCASSQTHSISLHNNHVNRTYEVNMDAVDLNRRLILLSSALAVASGSKSVLGSPINLEQTFIEQRENIQFKPLPLAGMPPHSGEMCTLYGDLNKEGPYLVMIRWNPGWFSAPHTYATDRIQVVVSGTWYVNSGDDFDPKSVVPVKAGGFVKRAARTPHYDGVPAHIKEPVTIAVFGMGPVDFQLVDQNKPTWRHA